jgi:serine/threonine protein kinase
LDEESKQQQPNNESTRSSENVLVEDNIKKVPSSDSTADDNSGIALGTILAERYEIQEFLGKGGMGSVYKARHTLIGNTIAIKVLHTHLINDAASKERFKAEAKSAISLRHPRLMSVSDYGVGPLGHPYIVMEYIKGISLDDLIAEKKFLENDEFFELFEQVCEGLASAHMKGVVHRDIKPSNIMLSKDESGKRNVHIVDFGIAKVLPRGESAVQHLTQTGEIFGSPLYMSPEQCKGREVDPRSDIYSLGCVMFEAVTGSPPHRGESAIETLMLHVNDKAPKITDRRKDIRDGSELEKIIAKALAIDPEERYQNLNHLKTDIVQKKFSGSQQSSADRAQARKQIESSGSSDLATSGVETQKSRLVKLLIVAASAILTVGIVFSFNIQQPSVGIVGGVNEQRLHEADLEYQLAKEKAAQGFTREAAEYSQRALDLRAQLAPNTVVLGESLNQRAEIALRDAEHEAMWLHGAKFGVNDKAADDKAIDDKAADGKSADDEAVEGKAAGDKAVDYKAANSRLQRISADYELAGKLAKEAIAIADAKAVGVEKAINPVRYRNTLASVYLDQGKFKDAEKVLAELKDLFLANQSKEKSDADLAQRALFDEQYERLLWGTGKELDAAKLSLSHHRPSVNPSDPVPVSEASDPFTGHWFNGSFALDLNQAGDKLSGKNSLLHSESKGSSVSGTVNGPIAHLTFVNANGSRVAASAVRLASVLIFHTKPVNASTEHGYIPTDAILELLPAHDDTTEEGKSIIDNKSQNDTGADSKQLSPTAVPGVTPKQEPGKGSESGADERPKSAVET